jgi:hypothetical protein
MRQNLPRGIAFYPDRVRSSQQAACPLFHESVVAYNERNV